MNKFADKIYGCLHLKDHIFNKNRGKKILKQNEKKKQIFQLKYEKLCMRTLLNTFLKDGDTNFSSFIKRDYNIYGSSNYKTNI